MPMMISKPTGTGTTKQPNTGINPMLVVAELRNLNNTLRNGVQVLQQISQVLQRIELKKR